MLFIATVEVSRSYYMQDGSKKNTETIPVYAEDEDEARDILNKHYEKKNDPYHVWVDHFVKDLQPVLTKESLGE